MTAYQRMQERMKTLEIYRLDGTSLTDYELQSYSNYLETINSRIQALFASCFVDDITYNNCTSLIKLFALPEDIGLEDLRRIIKARMSINNRDFTVAGINKCLEAGGFTATYTEDFASRSVIVTVKSDMNLFATNEEKRDYIKQCMPCHLGVTIIL